MPRGANDAFEVIGVVKIIVGRDNHDDCIGIIEMTIVGKSWRLLREAGTVVTTTAALSTTRATAR